MDQSAIKEIEALTIDAHYANNSLKTDVPAIVLGGKVISLEHLQAHRSRFRGHFSTSDIASFVSYVRAHPGGTGFVDPENMTAQVFFNLGDDKGEAGHGDWNAVLDLPYTAAYSALLNTQGKLYDQRGLIDLIADWNDYFAPVDSEGSLVNRAAALDAIRTVTIKTATEDTNVERDFGGRRSSLAEVEANSKGDLPYGLAFRVAPCHGLSERTFYMRLVIRTSEDKPKFSLRLTGAEAIKQSLGEEFRDVLRSEVGSAATINVGRWTM